MSTSTVVSNKTFTEADGTERVFSFGKMNAVDSVKVYYPLMKILPAMLKALGPLLGKLQGLQAALVNPEAKDGEAPKLSPALILEALTQLTEGDQLMVIVDAIITRLSSDELVAMMKSVFRSVRIAAQQVDMDIHFGGGLSKTMLLVFLEGLKVNFSDFLGAARSASNVVAVPAA